VNANGEYLLTRSGGRTHRFTVAGVSDAIVISGPWMLRLGETSSFDLAQLQSWTDLAQGKGYSGWGTYETNVSDERSGRRHRVGARSRRGS